MHFESLSSLTGITYSFKGLLLIFGLFLAYETRSLVRIWKAHLTKNVKTFSAERFTSNSF